VGGKKSIIMKYSGNKKTSRVGRMVLKGNGVINKLNEGNQPQIYESVEFAYL